MGKSWTLRCRTCKQTLGPFPLAEQAGRLAGGREKLPCGHFGAEVLQDR